MKMSIIYALISAIAKNSETIAYINIMQEYLFVAN